MKRYVSLLAVAAFMLMPVHTVLAQGSRSEAAERRELAQANAQEARDRAKERVETIKLEAEERKATIKQEVCERRLERLQTTLPRLANGANTVKGSIDKVYERVQGFYESGQLTVANYDELNENVATAKAEAEVVLESVNAYEVVLDCENSSVGEQLDGFRATVSASKESLKNYRSQLVILISEMRSAAADQTETEEDTSDDPSNDTQDEELIETETPETEVPVSEGVENEQE